MATGNWHAQIRETVLRYRWSAVAVTLGLGLDVSGWTSERAAICLYGIGFTYLAWLVLNDDVVRKPIEGRWPKLLAWLLGSVVLAGVSTTALLLYQHEGPVLMAMDLTAAWATTSQKEAGYDLDFSLEFKSIGGEEVCRPKLEVVVGVRNGTFLKHADSTNCLKTGSGFVREIPLTLTAPPTEPLFLHARLTYQDGRGDHTVTDRWWMTYRFALGKRPLAHTTEDDRARFEPYVASAFRSSDDN